MKRQIRCSVFETNSSSTHSIAISKKPVVPNRTVHFGIGEFGWANDVVSIEDYLYTAILIQDNAEELLEKLKDILVKRSITYVFEEPRYVTFTWCDDKFLANGYIDHGNETIDFILAVLNDEDLLMRCLFGDSCVYTGNDNQDADLSGCNIANEYYWTEENGKYVKKPNPYHDSENYDYFMKLN